MKASEFAQLVKVSKRGSNGSWWEAHCPGHNDRNPSLGFKDGDRGLIVKCHAECSVDHICSALGIKPKDLFHKSNSNGHYPKKRIIETYSYTDESGNQLFEVVRTNRCFPAVADIAGPAQLVTYLSLSSESWHEEKVQRNSINIGRRESVNVAVSGDIRQRSITDFVNIDFHRDLVPLNVGHTSIVHRRRKVRRYTCSLKTQCCPRRAITL